MANEDVIIGKFDATGMGLMRFIFESDIFSK